MVKKKKPFIVTKEGLKKLEKELEYRVGEKKEELAKLLQESIEKGDLSENAEYDMALEWTLENDQEAGKLKDKIARAEVQEGGNGEEVVIGSKVKVKEEDGTEKEFSIVGEVEADPLKLKISHNSPIGMAIIGKKLGEKFDTKTPGGTKVYTIMEIS